LDQVAEKWEWKSKIKVAVLICDAPGHTRTCTTSHMTGTWRGMWEATLEA
jgi:hypothetical protein